MVCVCLVSSTTVAEQYELFNKELGLDETTEPKKEEAKESGKDEATEQGNLGNCIFSF